MVVLAALLAALLAAPLAAAPARVETAHVTVSLVSEVDAIRPGETFTLGLLLEPAPEWHVYWRNPGDSGEEPKVRWR